MLKIQRLFLYSVFTAVLLRLFVHESLHTYIGLCAAGLQSRIVQHKIFQVWVPADYTAREDQYEVHLFSRDPLVLYIHRFVSKDEIEHLLKIRLDCTELCSSCTYRTDKRGFQ